MIFFVCLWGTIAKVGREVMRGTNVGEKKGKDEKKVARISETKKWKMGVVRRPKGQIGDSYNQVNINNMAIEVFVYGLNQVKMGGERGESLL